MFIVHKKTTYKYNSSVIVARKCTNFSHQYEIMNDYIVEWNGVKNAPFGSLESLKSSRFRGLRPLATPPPPPLGLRPWTPPIFGSVATSLAAQSTIQAGTSTNNYFRFGTSNKLVEKAWARQTAMPSVEVQKAEQNRNERLMGMNCRQYSAFKSRA